MTRNNSQWAARAKRLDLYRWQLLRQRHGTSGGALRFLRDALVDTLFGMAACWRLATTVIPEGCDLLLLQASPKVVPLQRKKILIAALASSERRFIETAIAERWTILGSRLLRKPPQQVPLRYFSYAAHATWIVEKYAPRILLNSRNGSFYTPFLRLALNAEGRLLVQLAHATTVDESRKLGMNDYDYYFLFGQSSLDALRLRSPRFGTSQVVLSGSHLIDTAYAMPPAQPDLRTVLILGVGPDKEKESGYQRSYELLRDWARLHPQYQVLCRCHPRSKNTFWSDAAKQLANIEVLPPQSSLAAALARASVAINIMSNAVIEAALAGRPVIAVCLSEDKDIFGQEQFFGERVTTIDALQTRLDEIEADYSQQVDRAHDFADFHLVHGVQGLEKTVQYLERLLVDGDLRNSDAVIATLSESL